MVSSTDGSPTSTWANRRSSAGSFSMRSRYSSSVVAPTRRSSPRASMGLSMLPASMEPSALPAPTSVCSSSMNVTIRPSESLISFSTALSRSSNSPRYFAPATIAARSREINRLPRRDSGTSPATIRDASPSTTAVFPTPGSPISTGLFLVRRDRTWTTRRISASRPITGSNLPARAAAVRSTPYFSSAWLVLSGSRLVTRLLPRRLRQGRAAAAPGGDLMLPQQIGDVARPGGQTDQQVLGRDVAVAEFAGPLLGGGQRGVCLPGHAGRGHR